jgi:hypothetical protein
MTENRILEGWTEEEVKNFQTLTNQEKMYYRVMKPKSGVLTLMAKPGIAKSAMARSIAEKMGMQYMDIRLSMVDETDVGLFPTLKEIDGVNFLDYAIPVWAKEANEKPTLIHFEELNRAALPVRNAALQILLERGIGTKFKFNENVLMMSSGNLGEEDGTDVEEFDNALKNRLITYNHTLDATDWIKNFAEKNVNPYIVEFIENNPEYLYKDPTDDMPAYATPRSWTFLSDFITMNFGKGATPAEFMNDISKVGMSYVGQSITRFIRFCQEKVQLSIEDIIKAKDFSKIEKDLKRFGRDKSSELLTSLKKKNLDEMKDKELKNVVLFLKTLDKDELMGYLVYVIDNEEVKSSQKKKVLMQFKKELLTLKDINNEDN